MVKKYAPILIIFALAWLFGSCGETSNPTPSQSFAATPDSTVPNSTEIPEQPSAPTESSPSQSPTPTQSVTPEASTTPAVASNALTVAKGLKVRGRSADTNYSRDAFGTAWKDVDRNGCDTRNDILQRDFTTAVFKPGTNDCKVIGGTWTDPYSNESYTFNEPPSGAQIDHVVSLKNAWTMGADMWSDQMRVEFANDPVNLVVTIASLNQQKSDSNAASWLPPYKPVRCAFIATQVAVKAKWQLFVTESEKEVFVTILSKPECAKIKLPN